MISKGDAKLFLTSSNYFFKVKAFDKDFDRYRVDENSKAWQYLNLDFAYLVKLSKLDRHLRSFILPTYLDTTLKLRLPKPVGVIAKQLVDTYGMEHELTAETKRIPFVHDFSALLITYDIVVPDSGARRERARALAQLSDRFSRHAEYSMKQGDLYRALLFIRQLTGRFSTILNYKQ